MVLYYLKVHLFSEKIQAGENMDNIIIDARVVPDVFLKVLRAKKNLELGRCKTVNEAIAEANISRSAFYKYKDFVFSYDENKYERIYTLFFTLEDISGILSQILAVLAEHGCNVLTINQNIPIHGVANITISFRHIGTNNINSIVGRMKDIEGITNVKILGIG